MHKLILLIIPTLFSFHIKCQTIRGIVKEKNNKIIEGVNIKTSLNQGTISNSNGEYDILLPANKSTIITFSYVGYKSEKIRIPGLKKNQNYELNITLDSINFLLENVVVTDRKKRKNNFNEIKAKHVNLLPGNSVGIEGIIKTLPGVSSANELSSQYSVRGGNFDENLVYVNGIEIFKPFLIRSGQQEGLSFVNTDMVDKILFSAGGFGAKYGDKMSSVLDITYKKPQNNKRKIELSLLGANTSVEGKSKNNLFTYLVGVRHKTNKYLFQSMDTEAEYTPSFYDIQTFLNYEINTKWSINFLGNANKNKYALIPENRETEFGTVNDALKLKIYFEGQEIDKYESIFGAITTVYKPRIEYKLYFTTSGYKTSEEENFDILGEYWLYQLNNNLGSDEFGNVAFERGVGKYINHARNKLNATILNFSHKGEFKKKSTDIYWGLKIQREKINDEISEWNLIDSAFFNFPHPQDSIGFDGDPNQQIELNEVLKTNIKLESQRYSGYIQFSKDYNNFTINSGTRTSFWSYNKELLISPRISMAYAPVWENDIIFRASTGIYYQAPFYKELRTELGTLNSNVKSQKSTHFVLGKDYLFYSWGRPFKWTSEIYYKNLENLIPYKIENVQIQYLTEQKSKGYATGLDMKINGEFVNGVESWASLSIMKTAENIVGDSRTNEFGQIESIGFIPRPTDQRVNFSMFFQDYVPNNPNFKMNLSMVYGTGLPFGPPKSEKHNATLKMPDYRRVDIGFSAILKSDKKKSKFNWLNKFNSIWITAEVFNLLDINNTVSYLWVSDITSRQYAVPNYLTGRKINAKLMISF